MSRRLCHGRLLQGQSPVETVYPKCLGQHQLCIGAVQPSRQEMG